MIELAILAYLIGGSTILVRAVYEIRKIRPQTTLKGSWWIDLIFFLLIFFLNPIVWMLMYFSYRSERKRFAQGNIHK